MKKNLLLVFLVLLAMVAYTGCGSSEDEGPVCTTNDDCEGDKVCNDGVCEDPAEDGDIETEDGDVETEDGDVDGDKEDTEDGDTEDEDGDTEDTGTCPDDFDCEAGQGCVDGACVPCTCETNTDCTEITEECGGCFCQPIECTDNSVCPAGTVCGPGVCVEVPDFCAGDTSEATIMITGGTGFLAQAEDVMLEAALFNADGEKVVLAAGLNNFAWAIGASEPATLTAATDADTATLTGGDAAGAVALTVSICDADKKVEATMAFTNFPTPTDARVVVFDSATGEVLDGVKVFLGNVATKADASVMTDADGVAVFAGLDCETTACDLHVLPETHTYVSAFGLMTNDILIPVAPNTDTTVAGGVIGHQNHADIPADLRGDVFLGISLFAIPGNLADLNFESLIGEMINTRVKIGGTIDEELPLPGGLEGYLNPDAAVSPLKDGFQVTGIGGSGSLWGLGGFTNLTDILTLLGPAIGGGDIEIGPIVAAIIPIFANFYHGIMPGVEFDENPKVADVDDINGNGETDDMVADFSKFEDLTDTFVLAQAQTQSALVKYAALPKDGSDNCLVDAAITLIGVMQTGVGFIPLGLSASLDEDENAAKDCTLDDVNVAFAPQHSGLSGYTYYTLSVALNINALTSGLKADGIELSGTISRSETIPTEISLPTYLGLMSGTEYNSATHALTTTDVDGADFHRVVFSVKDDDSQNYWHIYWKTGNGFSFDFAGLGVTEDRTANFSSASLAQAIALDNVDYDGLFSFNATNLNDMNGFIDGFSMATVADTTPVK